MLDLLGVFCFPAGGGFTGDFAGDFEGDAGRTVSGDELEDELLQLLHYIHRRVLT